METTLIISSALLWIMLLLNLLLTLGLSRRLNARFPKMDFLKIGQIAPSFTVQTLQGETVTLMSYSGQPVAFFFMSPHCKPCRVELPKLEELHPKVEQLGVELVLVSDASEAETQSFADELELKLPILIAPRERTSFLSDYKAMVTPSFCLVDAKGKVQAVGLSLSELEEKMKSL